MDVKIPIKHNHNNYKLVGPQCADMKPSGNVWSKLNHADHMGKYNLI